MPPMLAWATQRPPPPGRRGERCLSTRWSARCSRTIRSRGQAWTAQCSFSSLPRLICGLFMAVSESIDDAFTSVSQRHWYLFKGLLACLEGRLGWLEGGLDAVRIEAQCSDWLCRGPSIRGSESRGGAEEAGPTVLMAPDFWKAGRAGGIRRA